MIDSTALIEEHKKEMEKINDQLCNLKKEMELRDQKLG